ncbi:MFS transporter [Plastoroseomonas hellenica]|uniref:MFS transporter n=1 Tax=Plastoroseomonas hellenica TaxID=2687306 RepID=UPI001BA8556B|nr:MFS transporter [Plastoroseomonas hellenica]MBR0646270.1 MFS transporter [Plastoroseomonas hellenica]
MSKLAALRPVLPILIGASLMLSIGMGLRQSLGIFVQPLTRDIGISIADFTLAIAVQNLAWGFLQPVAGALVVRLGFRPVMVFGAAAHAAGLLLLAGAQGQVSVVLGAGLLIGLSLACSAIAIALAVGAQVVPAALRSATLGVISAVGSLGSLLAAPLGQILAEDHGWRAGILGFAALAMLMLPAAWVAGGADRVPVREAGRGEAIPAAASGGAAAAARIALGTPAFVVMTAAYFVCGMQLIFLTTHLPSYLTICGMDPMLSAEALGVIGGFNVLGSLFFGWAGGRWNKQALLGLIYLLRSLALGAYFAWPPSAASTLVFAAVMGFLWLGVGPLVAGSVAEMFGLRWQAMISGIAFMSHQLGSFLGAYGGGLIFDALGSYDLAWRAGVGLGLLAGVVQIGFALGRPRGPSLATAG